VRGKWRVRAGNIPSLDGALEPAHIAGRYTASENRSENLLPPFEAVKVTAGERSARGKSWEGAMQKPGNGGGAGREAERNVRTSGGAARDHLHLLGGNLSLIS
jgi:hypothetical protein